MMKKLEYILFDEIAKAFDKEENVDLEALRKDVSNLPRIHYANASDYEYDLEGVVSDIQYLRQAIKYSYEYLYETPYLVNHKEETLKNYYLRLGYVLSLIERSEIKKEIDFFVEMVKSISEKEMKLEKITVSRENSTYDSDNQIFTFGESYRKSSNQGSTLNGAQASSLFYILYSHFDLKQYTHSRIHFEAMSCRGIQNYINEPKKVENQEINDKLLKSIEDLAKGHPSTESDLAILKGEWSNKKSTLRPIDFKKLVPTFLNMVVHAQYLSQQK